MLFAHIFLAFPVLFTLHFAFLFGVIHDIRASAFVFLWNVNKACFYFEVPLFVVGWRAARSRLASPAPAGSALAVC